MRGLILADSTAVCQRRDRIKGGPYRKEDAMLRFEGDRDFSQPSAELWTRLTDARFLVECIPDVEKVTELSPEQAALVLRPSFAFVRGSLEVKLDLVDKAGGITVSNERALLC